MSDAIQDPQLTARLIEIDRRLREIQAELRPGETASDPPIEPELVRAGGREGPLADLLQRIPRQHRLAGEEVLRRFEQLTAVQADVAASLRDLLDGFDRALGQLAGAATDELTISAGPFDTISDVHEFVAELTRMPGVSDAVLRGFEGTDHAVVEVRLRRANPYP